MEKVKLYLWSLGDIGLIVTSLLAEMDPVLRTIGVVVGIIVGILTTVKLIKDLFRKKQF